MNFGSVFFLLREVKNFWQQICGTLFVGTQRNLAALWIWPIDTKPIPRISWTLVLSPALPCGVMYQSFTDALVAISAILPTIKLPSPSREHSWEHHCIVVRPTVIHEGRHSIPETVVICSYAAVPLLHAAAANPLQLKPADRAAASTRVLRDLFFMAALCIFMLWFLLLLFSSPNLSGRRLDAYHTSTHVVALVWI